VRQEVMEYYGVPDARVTTVLLGVSPEFKPLDAGRCLPALAQFGLQPGRYLLAVGTLEPRKNLSTMIAAFERLPAGLRRRFPLVIVGMNGWGMERFSGKVRHMIADGEVHLLGYVPQGDLPALYSGARLFVYPSLYEGFGLPPLEAMACGVPVIASCRASLPEVVGDAGVLVEALDDHAIAQHMQALIEDDALHACLSEAGRARAQTFTWRKFAHETIAVYKKVIS
jgi:glycosyltransferase involved in cell wall biosynthesis